MSKITNDGLTRSDTGCFYSCSHMATLGVKGLKYEKTYTHAGVELVPAESTTNTCQSVTLLTEPQVSTEALYTTPA